MATEDTCKRCGHPCHCDENNNPHHECPECEPRAPEGLSCPICGCKDPE